jgi:hypothetical protein
VYLAGQLNRPVSFFLEETSNASCVQASRDAFARKEYALAWELLQDYRQPDDLWDAEYYLLQTLLLIHRAELELDRAPYARKLLEQADQIVRIDYGRSFRGSLSAASAATVLAFEIYRQNLACESEI